MTAATIIAQPLPPQIRSLHLQDNSMTNDSTGNSEETKATSPHDDHNHGAVPIHEEGLLEGPYSRLLGDTEHNWCRAVDSGTGITVLSLLFARVLDTVTLQLAVNSVQLQHPRLRSHLLWIQGRPAFQVSKHPCVEVDVVDVTNSPPASQVESEEGNDLDNGEEEWCTAEVQDSENHKWMTHLETELNENMWPERQHCLDPIAMFVVRLYLLPENHSLLILRVHTAVCDRVAAATVVIDVLKALRDSSRIVQETGSAVSGDPSQPSNPSHQCCNNSIVETCNLMSVEDGIPPGKANKPFWAHGIDLLGYSLGTRRHALLPFDEPSAPRRSKFFHSILSVAHTKLLLQECETRNVSVYGVLCAAGMKAAAAIKLLGRRSEHFAIISLVNCRRLLQPELSDSTVGFYHSALMNTHHVNELTDFWDLARRCSCSVDDSLRNRKHFTDMGDLNFLMFQALQHPGLTPSCSMRTSLLVLFRDPVVGETEDLVKDVGVQHYVGCSSIHGVGPSLAIFDSIRNGALHFSGVYPTPLYSRAQMLSYVRLMVDIVVESLEE